MARIIDFTATDINGHSHHLQEYLDAGKTVIIDLSATGCGPCWKLHQSKVLDSLHNLYGPAGTNELVVLWIEIDPESDLAAIHGQGESTMGDFTNNNTWVVPIINDHTIESCFSALFDGGVPTVYMVCSNGFYTDITTSIWEGTQAAHSKLNTCPNQTSPPIAEIIAPLAINVNTALQIKSNVLSVDPNLSYEWNVTNASPSSGTNPNIDVSWSEAGTFDINLIVRNTSNETRINKSILVVNCTPITSIPYFESFDNGNACWKAIDADGDNYNWDADLFHNTTNTHTGSGCIGSASFENNIELNPNNWLISPKIHFTNNQAELSFWVNSMDPNFGAEKYAVYVSTSSDNIADFTETIQAPEILSNTDWIQKKIDISRFANQDFYIAFRHFDCTNQYYLLLDDIALTIPTSISAEKKLETNLYPNPANDMLNINFKSNSGTTHISIINILGKEIFSANTIDNEIAIPTHEFSEGVYIVKINDVCHKFIIKR